MSFIKNVLLGILLYEGIKYWLKKNSGTLAEPGNIMLGGKQFSKTEHQIADVRHRHHLDRPEVIPE